VSLTDDEKRFGLPRVMLDLLDAKEPGLGAKLQEFLRKIQRIWVSRELTPKLIFLKGSANGVRWPVAAIYPPDGKVYFSYLKNEAKKSGSHEEVKRYLDECRTLTEERTQALSLSL
jgi:hypothetical protein